MGEIRQRGDKRVIAFCGKADFDTALLSSNTFEIEWPPRSGRLQSFPEVDRADSSQGYATGQGKAKPIVSGGGKMTEPETPTTKELIEPTRARRAKNLNAIPEE